MGRVDDIHVLADIPRIQARAQPRTTAQIFRDRATNYAELDQHANQVANGLIALGCRPGTRIGYLGKNSDLYFELLLGALKANVVLVPVNWRLAPPEAAAILIDAGVAILFVGFGFEPMVEAVVASGYAASQHFVMDGAGLSWPGFAAWRDAQPAADPMLPIAPQDTAIQLYTSGTTGLPKGVELTNRNYLASIADYQTATFSGTGPEDVGTDLYAGIPLRGDERGYLLLRSWLHQHCARRGQRSRGDRCHPSLWYHHRCSGPRSHSRPGAASGCRARRP